MASILILNIHPYRALGNAQTRAGQRIVYQVWDQAEGAEDISANCQDAQEMALLPSRDKRCGAEIDTAKFLLLELGAARSGKPKHAYDAPDG